jgi:hypothetical protein
MSNPHHDDIDMKLNALRADAEGLYALTINLRTYYALRRAAVRQKSQRLRRDADRVLAHFDRCHARFFGEGKAAFNPDQPRVPAGNPDGGQWTSDGGGLEQSLTTAPDQPPRSDLRQLQEIANDPLVRGRIDEAWSASNPIGARAQEHGFWISRNEVTGELFTRPFANPGSAARMTPGPTPSDAIAFFHTHPNRPEAGFRSGPSVGDQNFATGVGLPGLIQSHNGMYYFGPALRARGSR